MMYDTFEVKGNCKGCGEGTEWHINGDYPLCRNCMISLINDAARIIIMTEKEAKDERN